MRPQAIVHFEIIAIIALVAGVVLNFMTQENYEQLYGFSYSLEFEAVIAVLTLGVIIWISRGGSNFARWLFIFIVVMGYVGHAFSFREIMSFGKIEAFSEPAMFILYVAQLYFLLSADGRSWFQK